MTAGSVSSLSESATLVHNVTYGEFVTELTGSKYMMSINTLTKYIMSISTGTKYITSINTLTKYIMSINIHGACRSRRAGVNLPLRLLPKAMYLCTRFCNYIAGLRTIKNNQIQELQINYIGIYVSLSSSPTYFRNFSCPISHATLWA